MGAEVAKWIEPTAIMVWSSNVVRGKHTGRLVLYYSILHRPQIIRTGICASTDASIHAIDIVAGCQLRFKHVYAIFDSVQHLPALVQTRDRAKSV